MIPILYAAEETQFTSHGLGNLTDAISCTVEEERNGPYELTLEYPIDGAHFSDIQNRRIILAKPNPQDQAQPFRIYKISKPLNGRCIIHAQHLSYDLSGIPVSSGWTANTVANTFGQITSHAMTTCPFSFSTDKSNSATFDLKQPMSARAILGGTEGSILDVFGTGEYKFDRYSVYLYVHRGQDRGTEVRYGKNLVDLTQEEEISACYSGVYGFYSYEDDQGQTVTVECSSVRPTGLSLAVPRILTLDLSEVTELTEPTQADVDTATDNYIAAHDMTTPNVNLTVDFVQLSGASWYDDDIAHLERVELCDTVKVVFEKLGVNASAKVIKTEYDVLLDRYQSIELGDPKTTLADTIINNTQSIKEIQKSEITESILSAAIERAGELLSGMIGGHLIIWNNQSQAPENPNELIITQYTPDDTTHNWLNEGHIWRFNLAGWGHSSAGYNDTYTTAATLDGGLLADFITAGTINAIDINGSHITGARIDGTDIYGGSLQSYTYSGGTLIAIAQIVNGSLYLCGNTISKVAAQLATAIYGTDYVGELDLYQNNTEMIHLGWHHNASTSEPLIEIKGNADGDGHLRTKDSSGKVVFDTTLKDEAGAYSGLYMTRSGKTVTLFIQGSTYITDATEVIINGFRPYHQAYVPIICKASADSKYHPGWLIIKTNGTMSGTYINASGGTTSISNGDAIYGTATYVCQSRLADITQ